MIREEYLRRLVDEAYVELHLSGVDGCRLYWPWRMQPPRSSHMGYRNTCEQYIIDSEPQSPTVTNRDVLDEAHRLNAERALLVDYFPFHMYEGDDLIDRDDNPEEWAAYQDIKREYGDAMTATIHSVEQGLALAEDHPFDGDIIVPLQAPFGECYDHFPDRDYYAIGGLNQSTDRERIDATRTVRDRAPDAWIHGLGWGARDDLVAAVHDDPDLLDSVDYSSPVQNAPMGDPGDERMSVLAAYAGAQLVRDLRQFSPYINDPPSVPETRPTAMDDFA